MCVRLTDDEADLTVMVIVSAGHHGAHRVIDHSHNVNVKVLRRNSFRLIIQCCLVFVVLKQAEAQKVNAMWQ